MARQKPPFFFEPWRAERSALANLPDCSGMPSEVASALADAHARRLRDADWVVWGSNLWEPTVLPSLLGEYRECDGSGIITIVRKPATEHPEPPTPEQLARRIATCVNACAGILHPEDAIERTRELLLHLLQGKAGADDPRVLSCALKLNPVVSDNGVAPYEE